MCFFLRRLFCRILLFVIIVGLYNLLNQRMTHYIVAGQVTETDIIDLSKVIITGDKTQKDLPSGAVSGLDVAMKVLKKIDDIGFCQLTSKDVVRHPLVQQIVQAYDAYEKKQKPERPARRRNGGNDR